jgi:hypothetical protein
MVEGIFSQVSSSYQSVLAIDSVGKSFLYFVAEIKKVFEERNETRGGLYFFSQDNNVVKESG